MAKNAGSEFMMCVPLISQRMLRVLTFKIKRSLVRVEEQNYP